MFRLLAVLTLMYSVNGMADSGNHRFECKGWLDQKTPEVSLPFWGNIKVYISGNPYIASNTGTGKYHFQTRDDQWKTIVFEKISASACGEQGVWRTNGVLTNTKCRPEVEYIKIETNIGTFEYSIIANEGMRSEFKLNAATSKAILSQYPATSYIREGLGCQDLDFWGN